MTNWHQKKTQCLTYSIILIDSVYKSDKSYCFQKFRWVQIYCSRSSNKKIFNQRLNWIIFQIHVHQLSLQHQSLLYLNNFFIHSFSVSVLVCLISLSLRHETPVTSSFFLQSKPLKSKASISSIYSSSSMKIHPETWP